MDGKGALPAHPVRRLADREHLAAAAATAADHGPLEDLDALLVALDHAHVHPHGVARLEGRDVLAELLRLDAVDRIHGTRSSYRSWRSGSRMMAPALRTETWW